MTKPVQALTEACSHQHRVPAEQRGCREAHASLNVHHPLNDQGQGGQPGRPGKEPEGEAAQEGGECGALAGLQRGGRAGTHEFWTAELLPFEATPAGGMLTNCLQAGRQACPYAPCR